MDSAQIAITIALLMKQMQSGRRLIQRESVLVPVLDMAAFTHTLLLDSKWERGKLIHFPPLAMAK
jgi:hypothetical protein